MGREQARAIAARLSGEHIDRIYASDLIRAYETAQIVAAPHGLDVTRDARLREFSFGAWEGLTWDEIVASRPQLRDLGATAARLYAPDGGERFEDVTARMRAFFDELATRAPGNEQHVVAVTHAGPLHAALEILGIGPDAGAAGPQAVSFSAASLTRVAMDAGRARLITLSDVRHLHPAG